MRIYGRDLLWCGGAGPAATRSLANFHCNFAPKLSTICIPKPWRCYAGRWCTWKRIPPTVKLRTQILKLCAQRPKRPEFSPPTSATTTAPTRRSTSCAMKLTRCTPSMDKTIASSDRIYARYWIETAYPLGDAAAIMAGEQSTGTFVRVPGETDELRERYAARVEQIVELGTVDSPTLAGSGLPKKHIGPVVRRAAEVTLTLHFENMGLALPNLLATVAGNLLELKPF